MGRVIGFGLQGRAGRDATTLLHFRHLLEERQSGAKPFQAQNEILDPVVPRYCVSAWTNPPRALGA